MRRRKKRRRDTQILIFVPTHIDITYFSLLSLPLALIPFSPDLSRLLYVHRIPVCLSVITVKIFSFLYIANRTLLLLGLLQVRTNTTRSKDDDDYDDDDDDDDNGENWRNLSDVMLT